MKQLLLLLICILFSIVTAAQTVIAGKVTDKKDMPITGANVFLEGTYDGASTDEQGNFYFETTASGVQRLIISFLSFETYVYEAEVTSMNALHVKLREAVNTLSEVALSAAD